MHHRMRFFKQRAVVAGDAPNHVRVDADAVVRQTLAPRLQAVGEDAEIRNPGRDRPERRAEAAGQTQQRIPVVVQVQTLGVGNQRIDARHRA